MDKELGGLTTAAPAPSPWAAAALFGSEDVTHVFLLVSDGL